MRPSLSPMSESNPPNLVISSQLPVDHANFRVDDEAAMRALSAAEDRHFWFVTRNAFIVQQLKALGVLPGQSVLELGCGGGAVASHLASVGYRVTGVDGQLPRLREAAHRAPSAHFMAHDLRRGAPPLKGPFDAVALFDVLEHLDEPRAGLDMAADFVKPGGVVVGTVPALMALWSQVDERSGHRLRYSRRTLRALLHAAPALSHVDMKDFNRHLVPMMWLQRAWVSRSDSTTKMSVENTAVPAAPLNWALTRLGEFENRAGSWLARTPAPGASLWFSARVGR